MDFSDTYAYLIAVQKYNNASELHELTQAFPNVQALEQTLRCETIGLTKSNIQTSIDPQNLTELLKDISKQVKDNSVKTLIFYYSGHGILDDDGRHYLTISSSTTENINIDGLDILKLQEIYGNVRNLNVILIFDSCFSEKAFERFDARNFLIIASSAKNTTSKYPLNTEFSAFTNELIKILKEGISGKDDYISWRDVYAELKDRLTNAGYPEPKISMQNEVDLLIAAKNIYKGSFEDIDNQWIKLVNNAGFYNPYLSQKIKLLKSTGTPRLALMLKEILLNNMPFPMGYYLAKIFRKDAKPSDYFRLYENSIRFLYYVYFMQIEHANNKAEINIYSDYKEIISNFNSAPGNVLLFKQLNGLGNDIRNNNIQFFLSELDLNEPEFLEAVEIIEDLRNAENPNLLSLKENMIKFLSKLCCLVNYKLISIKDIRLIYPKYKEKRYTHSISELHGDKPSQYEKWTEIDTGLQQLFIDQIDAAHSHSVLLMSRDARMPVDNINLWPLIIDANVYSNDTNKNFNPELYWYVGKNARGDLMYEPIIKSEESSPRTSQELMPFYEREEFQPFESLLV